MRVAASYPCSLQWTNILSGYRAFKSIMSHVRLCVYEKRHLSVLV